MAPEITLGTHTDLIFTMVMCLIREGKQQKWCEIYIRGHPHLYRWIDMALVPSETELFSAVMKTNLILKGISFLGNWAEIRPLFLYSFCP